MSDNQTAERKKYEAAKADRSASPDVVEHLRKLALQSEAKAPAATE